jgi:hypothetical protein
VKYRHKHLHHRKGQRSLPHDLHTPVYFMLHSHPSNHKYLHSSRQVWCHLYSQEFNICVSITRNLMISFYSKAK